MSRIAFKKYQGTGNDFVIFQGVRSLSKEQIIQICNRKFGIGADGVILMNKDSDYDFDMMYYNSDGSESFCGNGSRCSVLYASHHGWITNECQFKSNDGVHSAKIEDAIVRLKMHDVPSYEYHGHDLVLHTGSPHYIKFIDKLEDYPVCESARNIRYSDIYAQEGINVNFIAKQENHLAIRTYERGVEDETLSCGTGVTAAALANHIDAGNANGSFETALMTLGGELSVEFEKTDHGFENIYLCGPAKYVFQGEIDV
ncbi:MAG: diaminopimelate epimerase [Bacteroidia bacterium]